MSGNVDRSYEGELKSLDTMIAQMGGLAEQALGQAIDALYHRDPDLAEVTLANDRSIDTLERLVDELAISIIARRAPVASDLRQIVTAIRIALDLERIGDLSKNIAKRAIAIAAEPRPKQVMTGFVHIGEAALRQLKDVLDAYSQRDADAALAVWQRDQEIDAMYNSLYSELLTTMMDEPQSASVYAHLLFGAKNIERIGDHATNIAETIYFLIHGKALGDERPKADSTSSLTLGRLMPAKA
ncbi:phosphate uptake regulator, PhoU [Rhodomicrobium vannielii ATCC 17100]|uniref:Phosphate-specific transport system accessory protein PhoU n=2 Tax=Rhodomicrobium TaxID=1068 RepID=E3I4M0_RHOVT|nr:MULTISPECIES: phosphate signaling complex protein PhoU [Rhodomicrobium]ADP71602.1 phosphate uptake regulator, PhoU [Rhodomicrobium vannielii ATCC 17100]KAI95628.1 PhoU family transcriptional regulator [Rhodomicrobium udaipurense JA643]MBJ7543061.1 phosphate signaling complex protein PhoU [Rhodomicrobium udaipurense]